MQKKNLDSFQKILQRCEVKQVGMTHQPKLDNVQAEATEAGLNPTLMHFVFDAEFKDAVTKIFLSQDGACPSLTEGTAFSTTRSIVYDAFCDDFGPMNFLSITNFIEMLDKEIQTVPKTQVVYIADKGPRAFTNAVFLLGAYLILKEKWVPTMVADRFSGLGGSLFEDFRDATYSAPDFGLKLIDCWRGLSRAQELCWLSFPSTNSQTEWGMIDSSEYAHYDNPFNADLHEVVPGKFVAFRGPTDLKGREFVDDRSRGCRNFSPSYYVPIFHSLGVSTVVRLNIPQYEPKAMEECGIELFDLQFQDCTAPPCRVVRQFLQIADRARGLVAVHCKAGLGRTGTLIALYMMRSHGFTAREAMGWLRIVRPGCVIGEQQHYLCAAERAILERMEARRAAAARSAGNSPLPSRPDSATPTEGSSPAGEVMEPAPAPPAPTSSPPTSHTMSPPCASTAPADAARPALRSQAFKFAASCPAMEHDPAFRGAGSAGSSAEELARQVAEGMVRRGAARGLRAILSTSPP